ncbi:MAG: hypothetical protein HRU41_09490 [Saprospiraceae bacterium]|nr:hypothetical protein [Saprospiraceae bacterium]
MLKYKLAFILLGFGVLPLLAQQDLSTPFYQNLWQANRTNPAFIPEHKIVMGLPGIYNNLHVENITYNDLIIQRDGQNIIDVDQGITLLDRENLLRENLDLETISLGFRTGNLQISLGHMLRYNAFANYPKTLPQLIWQGNAQFVGQNVAFGPDLQLNAYHEYSLGLAYQLGSRLTIGAKAKYLSGVADVSTARTDLRLSTSDDVYQLQLDADYLVNSSGALQYDGFDQLDLDFSFGQVETAQLFSNNNGLAFDLGVHLDLGKLDIGISALDIGGQIDWKEDVRNYSLQGQFEYQGLNVAQGILDSQTDLGNAIDTLREIYNPVETQQGYRTELPLRTYLTLGYDLTQKIRLGALFYTESYREETYGALAINGQWTLHPILTLGATYAYRQQRYDNFGIQAIAKVGPVQLVAATDNIFTAIQPKDSHSANFRVGLNLLFNKLQEEDWNQRESFFE